MGHRVDSSQGGTLGLVGSGDLRHTMCIGGKRTPPTPPPTHDINMSATVETLTAQLQELQETFTKSIETIATAIVEIQNEQNQKQSSDQLAPFNAFLMVELTPHFGGKESKQIVDKLTKCREINDYRFFTPMYKIAGEDLKKRQLLKLVSAVHRYKFGGYKTTEKYSLKSVIKYAKECDECGKLANVLYNRLVNEGLW
jgi:hypothetical protein